MPRIRSVKPEFWSDSRMSRLSALERLVFLCLWSMADDEGRIEGDALTVWRFGSFREDSREIATALEALRSTQRVRLYEVDGNPYIEVVNFAKHQKIDHAKKSKIPAYSTGCDLLSETLANPREASRMSALDQGSGIRDQGAGIREQGAGRKNGAAASPPTDPVKEEIWTTGRGLLIGQGMARDAAGAFLGKLVKDFGQVLVLQAVRDCVETAPAEAKAWLVARCQERRTAGGKQAALEARNAEVARRFVEAGNA